MAEKEIASSDTMILRDQSSIVPGRLAEQIVQGAEFGS